MGSFYALLFCRIRTVSFANIFSIFTFTVWDFIRLPIVLPLLMSFLIFNGFLFSWGGKGGRVWAGDSFFGSFWGKFPLELLLGKRSLFGSFFSFLFFLFIFFSSCSFVLHGLFHGLGIFATGQTAPRFVYLWRNSVRRTELSRTFDTPTF